MNKIFLRRDTKEGSIRLGKSFGKEGMKTFNSDKLMMKRIFLGFKNQNDVN